MAKSQFNGELLHFSPVRFRVTGSGVLKTSLNSLDDVIISQLPDINMSSITAREPLILANYINQRGCLYGGTTAIDEVFNISKIVVYVKIVATGYPQ